MKTILSLSLLISMIVILTNASYSYALCTQNFSNANFTTVSGIYKSTDSQGLNVIHNNLSSHQLSISLSKIEDEADCFLQDSYVLLLQGTGVSANNFEQIKDEDENYVYYWNFDLSDFTTVLSSPTQEFLFAYSQDTSIQESLIVSVDLEDPQISTPRVYEGNTPYTFNSLNPLEVGDEVTFEFQILDDTTIDDVTLSNVDGGNIILGFEQISNTDNYRFSVNLTDSPLTARIIAKDGINRESEYILEFAFDSNEPVIQSLEFTSYEIESDSHLFYANLTLLDDFEIPRDLIDVYAVELQENSRLTIAIESCSAEQKDSSVKHITTCVLKSNNFYADSSFDITFHIKVIDVAQNEVIEEITKEVFIDSTPPEITSFELINPIGEKNVVSKYLTSDSVLRLEFESTTPDLYTQSTFDDGLSGESFQVIPSFENIDEEEGYCYEELGVNVCEWNMSEEEVEDLESDFTVSVAVLDVAGNVDQEEITVLVDNVAPEILEVEIVERGNERNNVLESYEEVRIEVKVQGNQDNEELFASTNGSSLIFRGSVGDVDFSCGFEEELEAHICYSNDFLLNAGFDGEDTELLYITVSDEAGNEESVSEEVKIFKINENDVIEHFNVKQSVILSPINRRVVTNQEVSVYHMFELEEKDSSSQFKIVSIELLGQTEDDIDVRLRDFELQNETSQGVVLGDNRVFYLQSVMPRLTSVYELEEDTKSQISISIIKTDEDTVYKLENESVELPISFYDMPRGVDSNVALAEKLLDDIYDVENSFFARNSIFDVYMSYYNLCNAIQSISGTVSLLSQTWYYFSIGVGFSTPADSAIGGSQNMLSWMTDSGGIVGKMCMLASCEFSESLIGDSEYGKFMTGKKTLLGQGLCKVE